ncbi:hypothetical protein GCM10027277_53560 [Pseudoduganella ginsengisoli]|nr:acyltransferase [Pseudoduganella ginsengisoli]
MKRLELLDYGRLAAALGVLAYHYLFFGVSKGLVTSISPVPAEVAWAKYGFLGVQFFFLISGFVIFQSACGKSAGSFLASRAARLYPAFWVALTCTALVAWLSGHAPIAITFKQYLVNTTMFYSELGQPPVDGVYWTLSYEWHFYLLVFGALALGLEARLPLLFGLWSLFLAFTYLVGGQSLPYGDSYYAWFVAGAFFAMLLRKKAWWMVACLALTLYVCYGALFAYCDRFLLDKGVPLDKGVAGAIITCQVVFFALLMTPRAAALRLPGSRLAGGLTYPLYLVHAHIGYVVLTRIGTESNRTMALIVTSIAMLLLAAAIHYGVERRYARFWQHLFTRTFGALGDAAAGRIARLTGRIGDAGSRDGQNWMR